jgi:hypothetical protein
MTKAEVISWLEEKGYTLTPLSRKGGTKNLYYVRSDKPGYRYSVSNVALRYELKVENTWVRIRSGYFSKLSVNDKHQLVGLMS